MFEPKQIIGGKIFIHYRRDEMLAIFSQYELPGCYFECLINTQNFTGHFVEVVAEPADHIRVIYIQKHGKNKIIALYNQTQQVIHLHPKQIIFSRWSLLHKGIPNLIYVFCFSIILLFLFFALVAVSNHQFHFFTVFLDALQFSGFGLLLWIFGFICPFVIPFYAFKRIHSLKLLYQLQLNDKQILHMEKLNPQNRIYHLNPVKNTVKRTA